MSRFPSRRTVVGGLAATGVIAGANPRWAMAAPDAVFAYGVAAGDPDHTSIILWTRVRPTPGRTAVMWEISRDRGFTQLAAQGSFETDASRDHTVKPLATGLEPGQVYYYRFRAGDAVSPIGRARTLPTGSLKRLGIGVATCSNFPFGYFNGYDAMAKDNALDFFLHLGDYIYEYGTDGYGGEVGKKLGRNHSPTHEIITLADYRQRHAQYKADPGLRAAHAALPSITIWDDHESANNPWMGGAENHQPEFEGRWSDRRAASLQAYYEWMPIREPSLGHTRAQYWRHYPFGDLASMVTLETRHTARAKQIDYKEHLPGIKTKADLERFKREVMAAPGRRMLAPEMEETLKAGIKDSLENNRPWRIIANQVLLGRNNVPSFDPAMLGPDALDPKNPVAADIAYFKRLGELDLPFYTDTWDGYPWARERFYDLCAKAGARDLLTLTGDSHSFWANKLITDKGEAMGLELGTAGITSPGDFESFGPEAAAKMDALVAAHNRDIDWTDDQHRGYIRLELTPTQATADYVAVSTVLKPDYEPSVIKSVKIMREDGTLRYV